MRGTATTASVWMMGATGAVVGYEHYEIAILLSLVTFLTLQVLTPVTERLRSQDRERPAEGE